jgi:hypothetical protein
MGGWNRIAPLVADLRESYADRAIKTYISRMNGLHGTKYMLFGEQSDDMDPITSPAHLRRWVGLEQHSPLTASGDWQVYENLPAGTQVVYFDNRPKQLFVIESTVPKELIHDSGAVIDSLLGKRSY